MSRQKQATKNYFNKVAGEWSKRAYNSDKKFLTFPTGKVRQDITISEMKRLNAGKRAIDLGCGAGELVVELLKNGYKAIGIDNAPNMIKEAKKTLSKELPKMDGSKIFYAKDVLSLDIKEKFDCLTAMGVLEYLEDDLAFFKKVKRLLNSGGYAFIECRNRLFNIASCNQYTLAAANSGDLKRLISQLDNIQKYSPASIKQIKEIAKGISGKIAKDIKGYPDIKISGKYKIPVVKQYPAAMAVRQHTPQELEGVVKRIGLKLRYVVYYHCHPYLPRYEKLFPALFNRTAFLMQPIGYTQLGSTICSAFVAVIKR